MDEQNDLREMASAFGLSEDDMKDIFADDDGAEDIDESIPSPTDETETEVDDSETSDDVTNPTSLTEIEIDGEKISIDELKQGYARSKDYIGNKATLDTEYAKLQKEREENQEALEIYNFLKENPNIAQELARIQPNAKPVTASIDPVFKEKFEHMEQMLYRQQLQSNIETLKAKYKDFNEVEVLKEASQRGIVDLEYVYQAQKGRNVDKLVEDMVNKKLVEAQAKREKNQGATTTISNKADVPPSTPNLTPQEQKIAKIFGMTDEEYLQYKQ